MQIIQNIRDKGAAIVIAVIALSLIGFILMDAQQGGAQLFGGGMNNDIGSVNGESISNTEFAARVKQLEDQEEQRSQQRPTGTRIYQMRDQMWNQIVAERIFFSETDKLGIRFTPKELTALLFSSDQANPFMQQGLADQTTGKLDIARAQEVWANIKKLKGAQREAANAQIVEPAKLGSIVNKYSSLLSASAYYPAWMQEKETAEANNFASINYVAIPYSEISDSSIQVSDADVTAYVAKNKELFKQEAGRKISYISFSQLPNAADSQQARKLVEDLKAPFQADSNAKAFVARNMSTIQFQDEFLPKAKLQTRQIDSILKYPAGIVVGPLFENGMYVLAKVLGSKELPDSAKARHILISMANEKGEEIMPDSSAKKLADSILAAVKGGADFAALASKYSTDPGSASKGGNYDYFEYGRMVPEFNEFVFTKPIGNKDVVKTQFGYHVIEVTGQKDFKPAYKIAYLAKDIIASEATINNASNEATKASAQKNAKALSSYAAKNGLQITQVPTIVKENDFSAGALQDARNLIKWAFDQKVGDVSEPLGVGDAFIVATVDAEVKEGTQDASTARSGAEAIIRNQKKAEIIKTKLGANPTLESAAAAYNRQVAVAGADSSITMASQMLNGIGIEPKLIGAAFNKDYQTKVSQAIAGASAVYLLKTIGIQPKNTVSPEAAMAQAGSRIAALRQQVGNWYESLRKQASIKDQRSKFY